MVREEFTADAGYTGIKAIVLIWCVPGGASLYWVKVVNPPGSWRNITEGKSIEGNLEFEGSRMGVTY